MPEAYDERGEPVAATGAPIPGQIGPPIPMSPYVPGQVPAGPLDNIEINRENAGTTPRTDLPWWMTPQAMIKPMAPSQSQMQAVQDYTSRMAQRGHLKEAQAAVDSSMRFLGMRGLERDVQAGIPYTEALSRHLPYLSWNNPQQALAYSKIIHQSAPPIPFGPVRSQPVLDDQGQPIPGAVATPGASGRGPVVHWNREQKPAMTTAQQRLILNDTIKDKGAEIDDAQTAGYAIPDKDKSAKAANDQKISALKAEQSELRKRRSAIGAEAKAKAESSNKAPKVGDIIDGHRFLGGDPSKRGSWQKTP